MTIFRAEKGIPEPVEEEKSEKKPEKKPETKTEEQFSFPVKPDREPDVRLSVEDVSIQDVSVQKGAFSGLQKPVLTQEEKLDFAGKLRIRLQEEKKAPEETLEEDSKDDEVVEQEETSTDLEG